MIHVGDVGTLIRVDFGGTDITSAINTVIKYEKPDGTAGSWPATIVDDGLEYNTVSGDIDQSGTWRLQGFIDMIVWSGSTKVVKIDVGESLI